MGDILAMLAGGEVEDVEVLQDGLNIYFNNGKVLFIFPDKEYKALLVGLAETEDRVLN